MPYESPAAAALMAEEKMVEEIQPFRLLDLPPELWARICQLAVVFPEPVMLGYWANLEPQARIAARPPAITLTSKIIRAETWGYYWQNNKFEWRDDANVRARYLWFWLERVCRSPLRSLHISNVTPSLFDIDLSRCEARNPNMSWQQLGGKGPVNDFLITLDPLK